MARMDRLSNYRTTVMCTNGRIAVTYVSTLIVDATPDQVTLDSGGWHTVTTKRKMNQASRQFGLGYAVLQRAGKWLVQMPRSGGVVDYFDGMTFPRGV